MKLRGKVYTTVFRPALLYGTDTWATTRGQEARLGINEMRMLIWMCRVTRRTKIRSEHNRGTTMKSGASVQENARKRFKWYSHVMRMKEEHIVRRLQGEDIPGEIRCFQVSRTALGNTVISMLYPNANKTIRVSLPFEHTSES